MPIDNIIPPIPSDSSAAPGSFSVPNPLPTGGPIPQNKPDKVVPKADQKPKTKQEELNKQLKESLANMLKMVFQQQVSEKPERAIDARARAKVIIPDDNNAFEENLSNASQLSMQPNQMAPAPKPSPNPDNSLAQQIDNIAKKAEELKAEALNATNKDLNKIIGYDSLAATLRDLKENLDQSSSQPNDITNQRNLVSNLKKLGENEMLKKANSGSDTLERLGENLANQADEAIRQDKMPKLNLSGESSKAK